LLVVGAVSASLLRMADLLPELMNNSKEVSYSKENLMLEHIRKCAMHKIPPPAPHCIELLQRLPSIQDVQQSYMKLRSICSLSNDHESHDERFLTMLEKSSWLLYVSLCIRISNEAAASLKAGESVVLQENDGRDQSAIISSIVQILLDPYFRTIIGFQTLIQKEWIALGHPFCERFGHVYTKNTDKSPLFLLFLDCIWQIQNQYPESFEFSETFLTTIFDGVLIPISDTFQFNCEYDRFTAMRDENLISRQIWEWPMFDDKDKALFLNPLYKKPHLDEHEIENYRKSKLPPTALKLPGMEIFNKQRFSTQAGRNVVLPSELLSFNLPPESIDMQTSNDNVVSSGKNTQVMNFTG